MITKKNYLSISLMLICGVVPGCSIVSGFFGINEVIATDFEVTPEWQEIRPPNPMTSSHRRQMIVLKVEGAKLPDTITDHAHNTSKTDWNSLAFPDGKLLTPELELIDERGVEHPLRGSEESGYGRGYSVSREDAATNSEGKTFVAVRILS
ncbi:MAG TPA: hypothetical protein VJV05_18030, partial [Pyrinomonadaceae bacterium]|nr:hypothetical protein [Pyrinomonadaceae bacterium]